MYSASQEPWACPASLIRLWQGPFHLPCSSWEPIFLFAGQLQWGDVFSLTPLLTLLIECLSLC